MSDTAITFGQQITALNEWDEPVTVTLVHGDRTKGIGYGPDGPTLVYGGVTQQAWRPGETWMWGVGDGLYFTLNRRPDGEVKWDRMEHGVQPGGGWNLV